MLIIIGIAILLSLISVWDFLKSYSIDQLLRQRQIELATLLIGIDLSKGFLLLIFAKQLNLSFVELYVIGLIMTLCSSTRWVRYRTYVQFTATIGFIWPLLPHFFNTLLALFLISAFINKNLFSPIKKAGYIIPIGSFFLLNNIYLLLSLWLIIFLIQRYLIEPSATLIEKKSYQEPSLRIYLG